MTISLEIREAHDMHETHGTKVDMHLDLGHCGMGMPVVRSWQAIQQLTVGGILYMSSTHPCTESDIIAWCDRSRQKLLSMVTGGQGRNFYIQRLR